MNSSTPTASTVVQAFTQQYPSSRPLLISAPGRINLIGEHTDYNDGFVLPAAVNKHIYFAFGPAKEECTVHSLNYNDQRSFNPVHEVATDAPAWARYLITATQELRERSYEVPPFTCIFGGDIPLGAGMSSSAALCCGFIYGLSELYDLKITREDNALIAQATEHRIGLQCGLMDQYAVLFGHDNQVLFLDCESLRYEHFPLELGDYTLVLINSMIKHEFAAESGYNERRASCERVVGIIRTDDPEVKTLRQVDGERLEAYRPRLSAEDYQRAHYVLNENQRVLDTVDALQRGDIRKAGTLMFASHTGMQREYEITTPELDTLVELAQQQGALGARMMGGGFGGCIIALMKKKNRKEAIQRITQSYQQTYDLTPEVYELALSEGVSRIEESQ